MVKTPDLNVNLKVPKRLSIRYGESFYHYDAMGDK
jgi:hypothetical protein